MFQNNKLDKSINLYHAYTTASVMAVVAGDVIRWEQQIRFRHMPTRQYLCITSDRRVTLTPDSKDPRTVFRLHPVIKVRLFTLFYFQFLLRDCMTLAVKTY